MTPSRAGQGSTSPPSTASKKKREKKLKSVKDNTHQSSVNKGENCMLESDVSFDGDQVSEIMLLKTQIETLKQEHKNELNILRTEFSAKFDTLNNVLKMKDDAIGKLNREIGELQKMCSFLTEETADLKGKLKTHEHALSTRAKAHEDLQIKTNDLEDRSRRNNLVFFNIPEKDVMQRGEQNVEDCEKIILDILERTNFFSPDYDIAIDRAHRLGRRTNNSNDRPRPIIVRFTYFKDKNDIIRNARKLKGTNVNVSEDFSKQTLFEHRELRKYAKLAKETQFNDPDKAIINYKVTYKRVVMTYTLNKHNQNSKTFTRSFTLQNVNENPTKWFVPSNNSRQ